MLLCPVVRVRVITGSSPRLSSGHLRTLAKAGFMPRHHEPVSHVHRREDGGDTRQPLPGTNEYIGPKTAQEAVTRAQVGHELSHPLARCVDGEAHIGLRVSIRNASKNEQVISRGLAWRLARAGRRTERLLMRLIRAYLPGAASGGRAEASSAPVTRAGAQDRPERSPRPCARLQDGNGSVSRFSRPYNAARLSQRALRRSGMSYRTHSPDALMVKRT